MNLSDVIGKEVFFFENKKYTDADFLKMPSEELVAFRARLNLKITNLVDIIKENKDVESDEWHKRKRYAHSLHTKMIPYIKAILRQRHEEKRNLGDYFMEQAKVILPTQEFETILSNAGREYRLSMQNGTN
jgi:hypothetical protein